MRTLQKNKQLMKYALLTGEQPVYKLDSEGNRIVDYVDDDGTIYYIETGETELGYSEPVSFFGNIAMSSGESQVSEFGVDVSEYDAIIIMQNGELPITETSLIWFESEVVYKDAEQTIIDGNSADYRVKKVSPSINQIKYLLERNVK